MPKLRAATRVLLAGAMSGGLAGCGHTASVGPSRTLRIAVTEYRVIPQNVRAAPGPLTLVVENDGRMAHTLAISSHGTVLGQTPPLLPGASAELLVSLRPGSYVMSSTLFSDQALGTYGTLTVAR
jgi:hypothetical protein